jgi:N-methylhydantoinase B
MTISPTAVDPVLLTVIANRFEAIVREMTNTLLRTGRSAVLNQARDFSCSIVTVDNRLIASAEGLPIHVFGSQLQTEAMLEFHPTVVAGDAYLHNDPYSGNTHPADHTILVPVFHDGIHLFTSCAKAHQADIGNSLATTYMYGARDIYEEGALIFPCVRVQRDYRDVDDVIRMCRRRIRVPEQWYGDYLAALAAARIGERRLQELVTKYGRDTIERFNENWFDYSEERMAQAISKLPSGEYVGSGSHDPLPGVPDGIPLKVVIRVDAEAGTVELDLRDNPDCIPAGINMTVTTASVSAIMGVFNVLDPTIPHNAGSFRRIRVLLRENCIAGIPRFPHSCSMATNPLSDRVVNITQHALAQIGEGWGVAEGGVASGAGLAVISGGDWRRRGAPYINQVILGNNGGPASPVSDGWFTWARPVCAGLLYRDSVEVDEQKYPIHIRSLEVLTDTGGAGRFRGAPAARAVFGPKRDSMLAIYSDDGVITPARGVRGGLPGSRARSYKIDAAGVEIPLPPAAEIVVSPGEWIAGEACGGGGYGDPWLRRPDAVLHDVLEGWVSISAARETYGVALRGSADDETLAVDPVETLSLRTELQSTK